MFRNSTVLERSRHELSKTVEFFDKYQKPFSGGHRLRLTDFDRLITRVAPSFEGGQSGVPPGPGTLRLQWRVRTLAWVALIAADKALTEGANRVPPSRAPPLRIGCPRFERRALTTISATAMPAHRSPAEVVGRVASVAGVAECDESTGRLFRSNSSQVQFINLEIRDRPRERVRAALAQSPCVAGVGRGLN